MGLATAVLFFFALLILLMPLVVYSPEWPVWYESTVRMVPAPRANASTVPQGTVVKKDDSDSPPPYASVTAASAAAPPRFSYYSKPPPPPTGAAADRSRLERVGAAVFDPQGPGFCVERL